MYRGGLRLVPEGKPVLEDLEIGVVEPAVNEPDALAGPFLTQT
jgi:hypothetical protein